MTFQIFFDKLFFDYERDIIPLDQRKEDDILINTLNGEFTAEIEHYLEEHKLPNSSFIHKKVAECMLDNFPTMEVEEAVIIVKNELLETQKEVEYVLFRCDNGSGKIINQYADQFHTALKEAGYTGRNTMNLSDYNDFGATFAQLATAIRKVPEAVFTNK